MKKLIIALLLLANSAFADGAGIPQTNMAFSAYLSGNFYSQHTGDAAVNASPVSNNGRMYAIPFTVASPQGYASFKAIGFRVATAGVGSTAKIAVYDSNGTGNRPSNKIAQGTNSGNGTATTCSNCDVVISFDTVPVTLSNGLYYLVQTHNATTTMPICVGWSSIPSYRSIMGITTANGQFNHPTVGGGAVYADTTYSSAFPSTFGTANEIQGKTGNWCELAIQAN